MSKRSGNSYSNCPNRPSKPGKSLLFIRMVARGTRGEQFVQSAARVPVGKTDHVPQGRPGSLPKSESRRQSSSPVSRAAAEAADGVASNLGYRRAKLQCLALKLRSGCPSVNAKHFKNVFQQYILCSYQDFVFTNKTRFH